eukprot:3985124-Pyramimonas_sp.AAC.1
MTLLHAVVKTVLSRSMYRRFLIGMPAALLYSEAAAMPIRKRQYIDLLNKAQDNYRIGNDGR